MVSELSTEERARVRVEAEDFAAGWGDGRAPYVRHIGNCGAAGSDNPEHARCDCGLRQTWRAL